MFDDILVNARADNRLVLEHFSNEPLREIRSVQQEGKRFGKPDGIWVSVAGEDDWPSWCEAEQFRDCASQHKTVVQLSETANVLHLTGAGEIDLFHGQFVTDAKPWRNDLDWEAVARRWDGIIIAPYCWDRRLDGDASGWYYGWDCASGVIWNADAIALLHTHGTHGKQQG